LGITTSFQRGHASQIRCQPIPGQSHPPEIEIVTRPFTENGCEVTAIVADPADVQQVLYGTVTRDGVLVGSYYCADRVRQSRLAHRHRRR
jgi:hypothetical protein